MHKINVWMFKHISVYSFVRILFKPAIEKIKLASFNVKWRKLNMHNSTVAGNRFPIEKVQVGKGVYGELFVHSWGGRGEHLSIGDYCSIADNVHIFLGGNHRTNTLSSYPFDEYFFMIAKNPKNFNGSKGPVVIDSDVWFGYNVIILSGVHIGQGAVIAAGSVVCHDVPPYAIYAGTTVRKYRFSDVIIKSLLKVNFEKIQLQNLRKVYSVPINEENIENIIKTLRNQSPSEWG